MEGNSAFSRPPTAQSAVLNELRRRLGNGTLRPGQSIRTELLAEEFGVSRLPVREALRVLEGEGQIQHTPHRGYWVANLTLRDLEELYRMRHLIETDAIVETVPLLGARDFDVMQQSLDQMAHASAQVDVRAHSQANRNFHQAFWDKLPWPRMHHQLELLYDWCSPYGALFYNEPSHRLLVASEHEIMLSCARTHDVHRVVELLVDHRSHVITSLRDVLTPLAPSDAGPGSAASTKTFVEH